MRDDLQAPPSAGRRRLPSARQLLLGAGALALGLLLAWWIRERFFRSDEDRIRGLILDAAQAARDRKPSGVSEILSADFKGPFGIDADTAHRILVRLLWNEYTQVEVDLSPLPFEVVLDPADRSKAQAVFRATVRGKVNDQAPWESIHAHAGGTLFRCSFRKSSHGWEMTALTVEP